MLKRIGLLKKYPLLKSLSLDYKYSYKKTLVKKYSNYSTFRIIGMGGSILGSEAIYQFLNKKIKKFIFINNLQAYRPKLKQKKNSKLSNFKVWKYFGNNC